LQLADFSGGGSFALERIQAPDRAVLWLPTLGVVEEQVEGCTLQPHPGMGLLIRPGTALVGQIHGCCGGISIVVPTALLALDNEEGYRVDAEAGPMLLNPFSRQRSGAVVHLLRLARQLVQTVESGGSALQTLTDSLIEQLQAWDRVDPLVGRSASPCGAVLPRCGGLDPAPSLRADQRGRCGHRSARQPADPSGEFQSRTRHEPRGGDQAAAALAASTLNSRVWRRLSYPCRVWAC
jgi:hypothetical protein